MLAEQYYTDTFDYTETNILDCQVFNRLVTGEINLIIVKNYYSNAACNFACSKIYKSGKIHNYINASNVKKIGMAFFESQNSLDSFRKYYDSVEKNNAMMQDFFSPFTPPIDSLMAQINRIWEPGIRLENLHGKKMFSGLLRFVDKDAEIMPHVDVLSHDIQKSFIAKSLQGQFAANIYLDVPKFGGELQIWDTGISINELNAIKEKDDYFVSREKLGPPAFTFKPCVGDLVIFNSRNFHAVAKCKEKRAAMSTFIGYRGEYQPLTFWS